VPLSKTDFFTTIFSRAPGDFFSWVFERGVNVYTAYLSGGAVYTSDDTSAGVPGRNWLILKQ
jgi:hypothetical protein